MLDLEHWGLTAKKFKTLAREAGFESITILNIAELPGNNVYLVY